MKKAGKIALWALSVLSVLVGLVLIKEYWPTTICFIMIGILINPLVLLFAKSKSVILCCIHIITAASILVVGLSVFFFPRVKPQTVEYVANAHDQAISNESDLDIDADKIQPTQLDEVDDSNAESTIENTSADEDVMSVHFIDVGQGDCTLVCCAGHYALIDAGPDDKGTRVQSYLVKQGINTLDYLFLSHPDSDHIGAADVIISKFDIGYILESPFSKNNEIEDDLHNAIEYRNYTSYVPNSGDTFSLGNATISVLQSTEYDDSNNSSLVLYLEHGKNSYIFTGDAETVAEDDLLTSGRKVKADVYHVGHHGSSTSSSDAFVRAVNPDYAVISCGNNNTYGHPHQETMDLFKQNRIKIFRLDEQGTVISYSDGTSITWNVDPSDDYSGGSMDIIPLGDVTYDGEGYVRGITNNSDYGTAPDGAVYVGNRKNMKLHLATCNGLPQPQNQEVFATLEEAIESGYTKDNQCKRCMPFGE